MKIRVNEGKSAVMLYLRLCICVIKIGIFIPIINIVLIFEQGPLYQHFFWALQ